MSEVTLLVQEKPNLDLHNRNELWKNKFKEEQVHDLTVKDLQSSDESELFLSLLENKEFVSLLRKKVEETVNKMFSPKETKGFIVYKDLDHDLKLNENYKNQVVVIDTETREFITAAPTIEGAFKRAKEKTDSKNLYFKKVGQDALFRV